MPAEREVTTAELRVACEELLEQVIRWRHPERYRPKAVEPDPENREQLLRRRSIEHGFTFTEENIAIEQKIDRLEALRAGCEQLGRPKLTLIEGGRDV